jgi:hypothetical protein
VHPGSAGIDRHEAAQREILAVEQERAAAAREVEQEWAAAPREVSPSDDEWEHMPKSKKWYMEAKVGCGLLPASLFVAQLPGGSGHVLVGIGSCGSRQRPDR